MLEVTSVRRKSPILTPSSLPCLQGTASINLTAGCAHDCLYCYIRGYRNYPGESRVVLYENLVDRLQSELRRKGDRITSVYFSPSSDLFQPVRAVLESGYQVLKLLLQAGIRVTFLTKGAIPKRHMQLLAEHAALVWAEIGLIGLDDTILKKFEPNAARAACRLAQAEELIRLGIGTEVRLDPIIPGFTDDEPGLRKLMSALAARGVRSIAASVLFLRPGIRGWLRRRLASADFEKLMSYFRNPTQLAIDDSDSRIEAIGAAQRRAIYELVSSLARECGIETKICACKNADVADGGCGIAGGFTSPVRRSLPLLFE